MKTRILCLLLAVMMTVPTALCGCADGKPEVTTGAAEDTADTTVPEAEDTSIKDDLPEVKFNGYTYRILGEGGPGWNASDILRPETFTEDGLQDAKLKRYMNVEERFDVKIETYLSDTVYTTVQSGILANDFSFDLICMSTANTFKASTANLLLDLKSAPYLNTDQPYYDQNYVADMSMAGKLFSAVTDIITMDMHVTWTMIYNRNLINKYDLESPYQLLKENKWTLDKLNEMLRNISEENGDGKWDEKDQYGLAAHVGSARNFFYAAGLSICTKDTATDIPQITLDANSEKLNLVADKVANMLYADNKTLMNTSIVEAFEEGRALFLAEIVGYLGRFREMKDDFGVIPYPKIDESQDRYYTTNDPCIMVFSLPAYTYKSDQLERSCIIFEGLCSESYNVVSPAYYIDVLSGKQTRYPEDYEMLELLRESRIYDFGLFNDIGSLTTIFSSLCSSAKPKTSSMLKAGVKSGTKRLAKILENYESH